MTDKALTLTGTRFQRIGLLLDALKSEMEGDKPGEGDELQQFYWEARDTVADLTREHLIAGYQGVCIAFAPPEIRRYL